MALRHGDGGVVATTALACSPGRDGAAAVARGTARQIGMARWAWPPGVSTVRRRRAVLVREAAGRRRPWLTSWTGITRSQSGRHGGGVPPGPGRRGRSGWHGGRGLPGCRRRGRRRAVVGAAPLE